MKHSQVTDEVLELTALYALGAMAPAESAQFEAHLQAGCSACSQELEAFQGTVWQLAASAAPVRPRSSLRDQLFARIQTNEMIQRSAEMPWEPAELPGLYLKRFYVDPREKRFFALARLEPDVLYPGHWHTDIEEMYMLGGQVCIEGQTLKAGDFYTAPPGNVHAIRSGPEGCTCLILSPEVDEPIEAARSGEAPLQLTVLRSDEGEWSDCGVPGVKLRALSNDSGRGTTTSLVRMNAGSRLPRHRHATSEQLYLLEGDAKVEDHRLDAGDFYRIDAGTVHEVTSTRGGCTFLLVSSALPAAA